MRLKAKVNYIFLYFALAVISVLMFVREFPLSYISAEGFFCRRYGFAGQMLSVIPQFSICVFLVIRLFYKENCIVKLGSKTNYNNFIFKKISVVAIVFGFLYVTFTIFILLFFTPYVIADKLNIMNQQMDIYTVWVKLFFAMILFLILFGQLYNLLMVILNNGVLSFLLMLFLMVIEDVVFSENSTIHLFYILRRPLIFAFPMQYYLIYVGISITLIFFIYTFTGFVIIRKDISLLRKKR